MTPKTEMARQLIERMQMKSGGQRRQRRQSSHNTDDDGEIVQMSAGMCVYVCFVFSKLK
jgi:hypothetical protein